MTRWFLAWAHLLGLGIGLGAVWARSRALRDVRDIPGMRRVLAADTWWGVAAVLWIGTGLLRAFAGFEKGTDYYLHNHLFLTKMGVLLLILLLEIRPIVVLTGWRRTIGRAETPDVSKAQALAATSLIQAVLAVVMVALATGMARGYGRAP